MTKHGPDKLKTKPLVIVGTIHSVKGGEAENVYVFPDLSPGGFQELQDLRRRDPILRVFYVAFTRAKRRLVLCGEATGASVSWKL